MTTTDWMLSVIVPILVSALVALLLGPLRAAWEEAARRDLNVRRQIAHDLTRVAVRLRQEVQNRKILKSGGQVPRGGFLSSVELDDLLWPIIRHLDDPDLRPKTAAQLRARLNRLAGWRVAYLSASPKPSSDSPGWDKNRRAFIAYMNLGEGAAETLMDEVLSEKGTWARAEQLLEEIERLIVAINPRFPHVVG